MISKQESYVLKSDGHLTPEEVERVSQTATSPVVRRSGHSRTRNVWCDVTPDFTRKIEYISYVRQDQFTHT
jgi:hypothetical protein